MRTRWIVTMTLMVAALTVAASSALRAQTMPRLPADEMMLPRSADSPGPVTFNHSTHVDSAKPDCTVCHPREFRILKANAGRKRILHSVMEKGGQCGSCHNGKKGFAIEADCANCHRG